VCCRQPAKILLPPQLSVFLSQPGQFSSLVAGELTLIRRTKITPVDSSLPNPLGQAAGGEAKPLGHSVATKVFSQAELNRFLLLMRREPAPCLGWIGHGSII
jgi:hypothetical protein